MTLGQTKSDRQVPWRRVRNGEVRWVAWSYYPIGFIERRTRKEVLRELDALVRAQGLFDEYIALLRKGMARLPEVMAETGRTIGEFAASLDPIAETNAAQPECPIGWNGEQVR